MATPRDYILEAQRAVADREAGRITFEALLGPLEFGGACTQSTYNAITAEPDAELRAAKLYNYLRRLDPLHGLNPNTHVFLFSRAWRVFCFRRYASNASRGVAYPRHSM